MAIPLDLNREGHPPGVRYPLFDLVRDNSVVANNAECVTVSPIADTGVPDVSFRLPANRAVDDSGTEKGQSDDHGRNP